MTPCPTDEDLAHVVDGALSVEQTHRLERHLAECVRCRDRVALLRTLVEDIRAPIAAAIDVRAHRRAVMDRLDVAAGGRWAPHWRWVSIGVGSAAAIALLADLGVQAALHRDTTQARGGPSGASIRRDVSVRPCALRPELQPLMPGSIVESATPLTATYRNLGVAPAYLLLFAVDVHRVVHWIAPRYAREGENPVATTLPPSPRDEALGTTVVLEDVSPGPLRILVVILPAPAHVSDVESLEGTEIDATHLAKVFPAGTDVRETIVEARASTGGSR